MITTSRRHGATLLAAARGDRPAELLIRNATLFVPSTKEWILTDLAISDGIVVGWGPRDAQIEIDLDGAAVTAGFIDAHMHIESTKLWMPNFVAAALPRGTVAVATDPHEMANVAGLPGVRAMIAATIGLPFTFGFSASSCVPASPLESPGAHFGIEEMKVILADPLGIGVAEVMNYPAVVRGDTEILAKIAAAGTGRVDGHAPGLRGRVLDAYLCAGVESDHEMTTIEELNEKRRKGMWAFLRQGSASQNIAALASSIVAYGTARTALCSDDREPDLLEDAGHMNDCIRVAVAHGIRLEDALVMATMNAADFHGFSLLGSLSPGMQADLCVFDSLESLEPREVYHRGTLVARDGQLLDLLPSAPVPEFLRNTVHLKTHLRPDQFELPVREGEQVRVIAVTEHSLWTGKLERTYRTDDRTIAQLSVVERHVSSGRFAHGLVEGFGIAQGAIASTVAHDAHNAMVLGANSPSGRRDMAIALERVVAIGGGQVVCLDGSILAEVPLPIAGLMSDEPLEVVARQVRAAQQAAHTHLGITIEAPFMTLSFLGLSVIPELKLTDLGLVDVSRFELVDLVLSSPHTQGRGL
ncbi:MAG: adenine deaminase [Ferrimicrobium sp.]